MDKASLEQRLEELKKFQREKILEAQAAEGAIQDCQFWLDELNKPEEEKKETENNG